MGQQPLHELLAFLLRQPLQLFVTDYQHQPPPMEKDLLINSP